MQLAVIGLPAASKLHATSVAGPAFSSGGTMPLPVKEPSGDTVRPRSLIGCTSTPPWMNPAAAGRPGSSPWPVTVSPLPMLSGEAGSVFTNRLAAEAVSLGREVGPGAGRPTLEGSLIRP